ncbi:MULTISPECIES: cold-shock protein [Bradyrhizobium]|uniref:cold-shock protein n=1 Tax=Bradyrhizobium TaxID=374 RepID=UPI003511D7CB
MVKWFNAAKGYGIIKHDGGVDLFVQIRAVEKAGYAAPAEGPGSASSSNQLRQSARRRVCALDDFSPSAAAENSRCIPCAQPA